MTTCPNCGHEWNAELPHDLSRQEPNVELMRGDYHDFPEHLWPYAKCIRDTWRISLPFKPKRGEKKSAFSFWITSMDELRQACGEHGVKVLEVLHKEYVEYAQSHGGTWPHTVTGPQSLINVARGKAAHMRTEIHQAPRPEHKPFVAEEIKFIPRPK